MAKSQFVLKTLANLNCLPFILKLLCMQNESHENTLFYVFRDGINMLL